MVRQLNSLRMLGENNDVQFDTSGDSLVDLIANGPDTFLQKHESHNVERYRRLLNSSYIQNPKKTLKILRYFRDRSKGQALKEQPLLGIAILMNQLGAEEMMTVLNVHKSQRPGSVATKMVDFLDLAKILAWHKYLHGKAAKVSSAFLSVCSAVIGSADSDRAMMQVLRYKGKNVSYTTDNSKQIGVIEILGMIQKDLCTTQPEVYSELTGFLYPRYRDHKYGTFPVGKLATEQWQYFKGLKPSGVVPQGISFEQVLAQKDTEGLKTLALSGRMSPYQLKINLSSLMRVLSKKELKKLVASKDLSFFPHELFAMGKAFKQGTKYTQPSPEGLALVNVLLEDLISKYKQTVKKNVLILADTSGSMCQPLSRKSTIMQNEFASFMSYFSSHVNSSKVFGTWDSTVHLYRSANVPSIEDIMDARLHSDMNTNIVQTLKATADYYKENSISAPEVICLISDMQFDAAQDGGFYFRGTRRSEAVEVGINYYKMITGVDPQIVYWNVNSNTVPSVEKEGVLMLSGFSANTTDIVFGLINQSEDKPGQKLTPQDILEYIDTHYQ
jgi:hypothetical protein